MKDKIVQRVIKKLEQRSETGIKTYGTTLADNLTDDFLKHLQEELMDAVNYIEKLMYDKEPKEIDYRQEFRNFLGEDLFQEYLEENRKAKKGRLWYNFKEINDEEIYLNNAFDWGDSNKGYHFWRVKDEEWLKYLETLKNKC